MKSNGKVPYAGKEKSKLPIPPRKTVDPTTQLGVLGPAPGFDANGNRVPDEIENLSMPIAIPDDLSMPEFLKVENRVPLTPEQQAAFDASVVKATLTEANAHSEDLRAKQKEAKAEKTKVRIEKLKAKKTGVASAMPLTGKAALAAIAGKPTSLGAAATAQVAAGRSNVVAPPAKAAQKPKGAKKAPKATKAPKAKKPASEARKGSKTAAIGALLTRKGGCTTEDILKATGWPSVSVPQQARACGLKLRKEKDGKVSRYFGS